MKSTEEQRFDQLLERRKRHIPQPDIDAWLAEDESEAYDRILHHRARTHRLIRWGVAAMLVVALMLGLAWRGHWDDDMVSKRSTPRMAEVPAALGPSPFPPSLRSPTLTPILALPPVGGRDSLLSINRDEKPSLPAGSPPHGGSGERGLPSDTLDDAVWQREENVLLALEMLADCEAAIQRGEQTARNDIIEATFRATPQPAHAILVSNEAGDNEVIELPTTIEI